MAVERNPVYDAWERQYYAQPNWVALQEFMNATKPWPEEYIEHQDSNAPAIGVDTPSDVADAG